MRFYPQFWASVICPLALCCNLSAQQQPKLRLQEVEDIQPLSHHVDLHLDPANPSFEGTIDMDLQINRATDIIWLNASKISVRSARFTQSGNQLTASPIPGGDDFLGLRLPSPVNKGTAQLHIEYIGQVRSPQPQGVFSGEDQGNKYLFTQFEASDARDAFPCFDEPAFKAPWQLTLHVPANDEAVANTIVKSQTIQGATKTVVFQPTKPLPSYLVAFAVGPFEYVDGGKAGHNHTPVRIIVPKGRTNEAVFAAKNTARIIEMLEAYFGIPYPFDKADQLCLLKADFGAMENAGLITYEASVLLAKPENDSITRQREYVLVASHELAHQWFGDLVTLNWWDDTWLNEAFASWMEHKMRAAWNSEWGHWEDVRDLQAAEVTDTFSAARQIHQPIASAADVETAFDEITYNKGAAVIEMFENYVGPAVFRAAVHDYLQRHAFRNATTDDLLNALNLASRRDVKTAFKTFVDQPGIPLLTVKTSCRDKQLSLQLEQHRMTSLGTRNVPDSLWQIPVCIHYGTANGDRSACQLVTQHTQDWTIPTGTCPTWLDANARAEGYYRVDYDEPTFGQLATPSNAKQLDPAEKTEFLDNTIALASIARVPYGTALPLVPLFAHDANPSVFEAALNLALSVRGYSSIGGGSLGNLLPDALEPNFERFIKTSFSERADALGWTAKPSESSNDKRLREILLFRYTVLADDQKLAAQSKGLVDQWLDGKPSVEPQEAESLLRAGAAFGDASEAARYRQVWTRTTDLQDKSALLTALRYFRDPASINDNLAAAFLSHQIEDDIGRTIFLALPTAQNRNLPLEFLKAHFSEVTQALPFFSRSGLPGYVGGHFCDPASREDLASFFGPRVEQIPGSARTLARTLERIDACIAARTRQAENIQSFLAAQ